MSYKELAFQATIVPEFKSSAVYAVSDTKVYYDTPNGVKIFDSEEKALSYLLSNLDLSSKYTFTDVFYNPNYAQQKEDGKKYNDYIMIIARKPAAVHNNIINYLMADPNNDGELAPDLVSERDLSKVQGLGLTLLMNDVLNEIQDIRDTFIYGQLEGKVTCDSLFNYIKQQAKKVRTEFKIAIIDVTGSELKSNFRNEIIVNDSLDIYREFIGGTTHSEEDFEPVNPDPDAPNDDDVAPDSTYI